MRVTGTCIAFRATRPMCFASIRATAASPCTAHSGTAPTSFRELTSILTGLSGRCLRAASKSCASTRQIPLLCKACVLSRSAEVLSPGTGASEGTFCRSAYKAHTAHSPQRSVGESGAPQRWEKGLPQPIAVRAHRRICSTACSRQLPLTRGVRRPITLWRFKSLHAQIV
jgi:hypothetical protein